MTSQRTTGRRPSGFTLIELLVVIAIIALLAGLTIAFFPSISNSQAESNGAANLQGWLNMARQKAIRNQNPYGLRFWITNATDNKQANYLQVTECSFIEQPDDFIGGQVSTSGPNSNTVLITGADPTGGFPAQNLWPVQPGDYLEVLQSGLMHQIVNVQPGPNPPPPPNYIFTLATPVPFQLAATSNYRIMRQAREVGEERLEMPGGVIVDLGTNSTYGNPLSVVQQGGGTGGSVDVLFTPSGAVLPSSVASNTMNFWVRQPDTTNPTNVFAGAPTIIAVWAQTGLVAAYAPAPSMPTPYYDVK